MMTTRGRFTAFGLADVAFNAAPFAGITQTGSTGVISAAPKPRGTPGHGHMMGIFTHRDKGRLGVALSGHFGSFSGIGFRQPVELN